MLLYAKFKHTSGIDQIIDQSTVQLSKKRIEPHYFKTSLLNRMLKLSIAGYANDSVADVLQT